LIIHKAASGTAVVFWAESRFEEKDEVKGAGFIWHGAVDCRPNCGACAAGLGKVWWTRHVDAARKLLEHADDDVKESLGAAVAPPPPPPPANAKKKPAKAKKAGALDEILEVPDDDHPRQVLADALLSKNDPRGEFIRLQLERERAKGKRAEELDAAARKLLKAHETRWLADLRPHLLTWRWRRGFLDVIRTNEEKWTAGAAAILAREPLRKAVIVNVRNFPGLVAMPELGRLQALGLPDDRLVAASMKLLVDSPTTKHLRGLWLQKNRIGDKGLEILAGGMDSLEELELGDCTDDRGPPITAKGIAALGRARFLPALKLLGLRSLTLYAQPGIVEAIGALKLQKGTFLDLGRNFYDEDAGRKLAQALLASKLPRVKLDLSSDYLSEASLEELGRRFELVERDTNAYYGVLGD
jgi:uncharacterized protein (TIGR02996 family)